MKNKSEPLLFIETVQTEINPPKQQLIFDSRTKKPIKTKEKQGTIPLLVDNKFTNKKTIKKS